MFKWESPERYLCPTPLVNKPTKRRNIRALPLMSDTEISRFIQTRCVCVCVLQSTLQKASKSQCSTRNSQRAQKLSTHFIQCARPSKPGMSKVPEATTCQQASHSLGVLDVRLSSFNHCNLRKLMISMERSCRILAIASPRALHGADHEGSSETFRSQ